MSIPTAGIRSVVFNDTVCMKLGFDAFNGTHCYTEPTSEWNPRNRTFESFEDLYEFLDEEGRTRLMDALKYYQNQQANANYSAVQTLYDVYFYVFLIVLFVMIADVLWQLAMYEARREKRTERPWPWKHFGGLTAFTNEFLVRAVVLIAMAAVNAVLWPVEFPLMAIALVARLWRKISSDSKGRDGKKIKKEEEEWEYEEESASSEDKDD